MLYNIYGSSKDWDEQILGHLHTIDVDPSQLEAALRHIAEEDLTPKEAA